MAKSIEPEVKDWFAQALSQHKTKYCIEQGTLNIEIENALKAAPSKSGGNGYGRPDFQLKPCTSVRIRYNNPNKIRIVPWRLLNWMLPGHFCC